tara:strand:+ start:416 stop:970 length:555 start_codon:yes stop_codon:yes gene_type:complete
MKKFLLTSLIVALFSPVSAETICILTSEEEADVTITMNSVPVSGGGYGTLNYRNKPTLYFQVGIFNGFGTQYYSARSYSSDVLTEGKNYTERTKNTEEISYGRFINFVGNQLARVTSEKDKRPGELRALMPSLAKDYYYSIPFTEEGKYGRQKLSKEMKSIIDASEGFFVNSGGCRKFFAYGWE